MTLWDLLLLMAAGVPLGVSLLRGKESGLIGILVGLAVGLCVGIVCFWVMRRVDKFISKRRRFPIESDMTFQSDFAYVVLYVGAILWIVLSGVLGFILTGSLSFLVQSN